MAFKFGWENYATGYSDFEIHRAQQKHYDAFTSVMVETGPGTWSLPSSWGSSSSSSSDDRPVVHNAAHISKGPAAGVQIGRGDLTIWVDGPSRKDPEEMKDWGVYGPPLVEPLADATRTIRSLPGPFGPITIYPHPDASDAETSTEQRLGDGPNTWIYGLWTDIADWAWTASRADQEVIRYVQDEEIRRAEMFRQSQPIYQQQWDDFNAQFPLVPEAFR